MSRVFLGMVAVALVATVSCVRTSLRAFDGWKIQQTPTEPVEGAFRHPQTGHLLGRSQGLVLAVDQEDSGSVFAVDDERCSMVLVEIPAVRRDALPTVVDNPRAYLRHWGCTWLEVSEEAATSGRVELKAKHPGAVQALIDVQFGDVRVRKSGSFILGEPEWTLQEPAAENAEHP